MKNPILHENINIPQKPYHQYAKGAEFSGEIIDYVFFASEDFMVYRTKGDKCVSCYYDDLNQDYKDNLDKVSHHESLLKGCVCSDKEHEKFQRHIALFYRESLFGNIETAIKISEKIIEEVNSFKYNYARLYYLLSCFSTVLILFIFSLIQDNFIQSDYLFPYTKLMLYGGLGGFISVTISVKKLSLDISFYNWSHSVYGIFRIILAVICALVSYLLIKSGFIFSNLDNDNMFIIYLFAVMAGFSETLIPNVLKQIENTELKK